MSFAPRSRAELQREKGAQRGTIRVRKRLWRINMRHCVGGAGGDCRRGDCAAAFRDVRGDGVRIGPELYSAIIRSSGGTSRLNGVNIFDYELLGMLSKNCARLYRGWHRATDAASAGCSACRQR